MEKAESKVWYETDEYEQLVTSFCNGLPEGTRNRDSLYNLVDFVYQCGWNDRGMAIAS